MAPSPHKVHNPPIGGVVILGINVKIPHLPDLSTGRILRQTPNIQDPQATSIITLVRKPVHDKLVVVDGHRCTAEVAGLFGFLEGADVPEVGYWVAAGCGGTVVLLVEFVVEDEEFLPEGVGYPALVGVYFGGGLVG